MQKRVMDILVSAFLLALFLVPIAAIALFLLVTQGRPIFLRQRRPGLREEAFTLIKFRTMRSDPNESEALNTHMPDSERLTRVGKWLRSTSLDELPTLWNVLVGNMSLVGPRPLLMHYLPLYDAEQRRRHDVRPGITGWAQINGRNALPWNERLRLDVWYVDNRTMLLDLKILVRTVIKTVAREGIEAPGEATSGPFTGSDR